MKFLFTWAALAGLYLLVAGVKDKAEIPAAIIAGLLLAALPGFLRRTWKGAFQVPLRELPGLLGPVPFKVLKDTGLLASELGKSLGRGVRPEGFIVRIPFRPPADGAAETRIALVTAVSTLPPNTIVIGYEEGHLIIHQLAGPPLQRREGQWPL